tara:strand:- start:1570 stop:1959 length:390 start_codon:yes stop_codon:yes gene_type:complete
MNSRQKGKHGELEAAKAIEEALDCGKMRRSQQYCGKAGDADIVGIDGIHIEVKRYKRISSIDFLRQAEIDARLGEVPIVVMRENGDKDWVVQVRLKSLKSLSSIIHLIGENNGTCGHKDQPASPGQHDD